MKKIAKGNPLLLSGLILVLLAGCATVPTGPSVMVLPPQGKPFDLFQKEDTACRQWATQQIGISPDDASKERVLRGATIGTIIGAGIGTLFGAAGGHAGGGAAFGAASGLIIGSASGASESQAYGWDAQRRYDSAYQQCMYANGNLIPGMRSRYTQRRLPPPPPPGAQEPYGSYELPPPPPPQR